MDDLASGTLYAGRYAVVRLLGRGSVKQVYLAYDRLTQTQVALSRLAERHGSDVLVGARFSREARASSALASPFTVRVFDAGKTADGERYLVSEAVLGRGLDQAVTAGPIAPTVAGTWAVEVLCALSEAHGRGLIHRDVKPENVMLAKTDGDPVGEVARLTDFGLAKILDQSLEGSVVVHTAAGVVMGTPDYMSPEQWAGAALDGRTDIYAVGIMLYEMLLGRLPFEAPSLHELAAMHCHASVPAFPADAPAQALAYEAIVRRALAKRPDERWSTADAMRGAIESAGGIRLPPPPTVRALIPDDEVLGAAGYVELMSDAGVGPVQVLATPRLVLGRTGHVVARCLPLNSENDNRSRSVSRRHARIEWHGGYASISDLHSASGTSVNGRSLAPGREAFRLEHGDEIALGPHVRFLFEHAATSAGALPPWARLTRLDRHGVGIAHVLVLTEATISSSHDAAIIAPHGALDARLILRARSGRLVALRDENEMPTELRDGQRWRLGETTWTVAIHDRHGGSPNPLR